MPHVNIEIKARCSNQETIGEILKSKNANFKGTDHQIDTYFKVKQGRLKLREGEDRDYLKGLPDVHEQDIPFQKKVRDIYLSLGHWSNYHIVPCAEKLVDDSWDVYPAEKLFESYKSWIDVLFM